MDLYSHYKKAIDGKKLPLAWIDLDKLDQNIAANLHRAAGTPVRIASKSIRCTYMLEYLIKSSSQFNGIMCYHPAEAAHLASKGFDHLLIAYPSLCQESLTSALDWVKTGTTMQFMVDSIEHIQALNTLCKKNNVTAQLCLDLDVSTRFPGLHFGVHRSSVNSAKSAVALFRKIQSFKNVTLTAVMGYEAQIAGVGDAIPGKNLHNRIVRHLKSLSIPRIAQRRTKTIAALRAAGAKITLVNGGGTGSIESTIKESSVTEVTVGSGFYCSHLFDYYQNFTLEPAAGFAIAITRKPRKGIITANGGGYVASGAPGTIKLPQIYLPPGLSLDNNETTGEVQTPLLLGNKSTALDLGDPVFFRHAKAGELCEHFNDIHLIRNGKIIDTVPTYRGEGLFFM